MGYSHYSVMKNEILSFINTKENKYTTLQRSTLIEFLKDDVYTQHLRFGKKN